MSDGMQLCSTPKHIFPTTSIYALLGLSQVQYEVKDYRIWSNRCALRRCGCIGIVVFSTRALPAHMSWSNPRAHCCCWLLWWWCCRHSDGERSQGEEDLLQVQEVHQAHGAQGHPVQVWQGLQLRPGTNCARWLTSHGHYTCRPSFW